MGTHDALERINTAFISNPLQKKKVLYERSMMYLSESKSDNFL